MDQVIRQHKYIWLDFVRALAALEVFLGHLRSIVFLNYRSGSQGTFKKIFYFFTGFAHEAVVIFFVLSGFFITDAVTRAKERNSFRFLSYGIDRLSRLWVVLIPGLVLTWACDFPGLHFFGNTPGYMGTIEYMGNIHVKDHLTLAAFLGNAVFLQNILVPTFGSNGPLWSLSNEFWYYVLFPMVIFLFWKEKISKKIMVICLLAAVCFFIGYQILQYFSIWLIGSALVYIKRNFPVPSGACRKIILALGLILFNFCLFKFRTGGELDFSKDFIAALLVAVLCYCGLFTDIFNKQIKKTISFLSGFSYSLYVVHLPLCFFITAALGATQKTWGLKNIGIYMLVALLVFGLSTLFWYFFESRYIQFRTFIKNKIFAGG